MSRKINSTYLRLGASKKAPVRLWDAGWWDGDTARVHPRSYGALFAEASALRRYLERGVKRRRLFLSRCWLRRGANGLYVFLHVAGSTSLGISRKKLFAFARKKRRRIANHALRRELKGRHWRRFPQPRRNTTQMPLGSSRFRSNLSHKAILKLLKKRTRRALVRSNRRQARGVVNPVTAFRARHRYTMFLKTALQRRFKINKELAKNNLKKTLKAKNKKKFRGQNWKNNNKVVNKRQTRFKFKSQQFKAGAFKFQKKTKFLAKGQKRTKKKNTNRKG